MSMELLQCLPQTIECAAQAAPSFGAAAVTVVAAMGTARLVMKPLQPFLIPLVEKTKPSWDNKIIKAVYWFLDFTMSIKVEPKKQNGNGTDK